MTTLQPQDIIGQIQRRQALGPDELRLLEIYAQRLTVSGAWWRDTADGMVRLALVTELEIAREKGDVVARTAYHDEMIAKDRERLTEAAQAKEATWMTVRGKKVWV